MYVLFLKGPADLGRIIEIHHYLFYINKSFIFSEGIHIHEYALIFFKVSYHVFLLFKE